MEISLKKSWQELQEDGHRITVEVTTKAFALRRPRRYAYEAGVPPPDQLRTIEVGDQTHVLKKTPKGWVKLKTEAKTPAEGNPRILQATPEELSEMFGLDLDKEKEDMDPLLQKAIDDLGRLERMKGVDAPETIESRSHLEALRKAVKKTDGEAQERGPMKKSVPARARYGKAEYGPEDYAGVMDRHGLSPRYHGFHDDPEANLASTSLSQFNDAMAGAGVREKDPTAAERMGDVINAYPNASEMGREGNLHHFYVHSQGPDKGGGTGYVASSLSGRVWRAGREGGEGGDTLTDEVGRMQLGREHQLLDRLAAAHGTATAWQG